MVGRSGGAVGRIALTTHTYIPKKSPPKPTNCPTTGLMPPGPSGLSPLSAAGPLLLAGAVSHPALAPWDPLLVLGLLAGAGSRGLLRLQGAYGI